METEIKDDPFVRGLLAKLPASARESFSPDQLVALKAALGGRAWGVHALDIRWTLKFWRWRYYFVLLAGRNRRDLTRREQEVARLAMALFIAAFITLSGLFGLLLLYLAKSAAGIDLLPGFSLGIWGWFQDAFLK